MSLPYSHFQNQLPWVLCLGSFSSRACDRLRGWRHLNNSKLMCSLSSSLQSKLQDSRKHTFFPLVKSPGYACKSHHSLYWCRDGIFSLPVAGCTCWWMQRKKCAFPSLVGTLPPFRAPDQSQSQCGLQGSPSCNIPSGTGCCSLSSPVSLSSWHLLQPLATLVMCGVPTCCCMSALSMLLHCVPLLL